MGEDAHSSDSYLADAASLSAFMTVVHLTDLKNADSTLCGWDQRQVVVLL